MVPRKFKIGIARFPYAGNGGTQSEHPDVSDFLGALERAVFADPRCEPHLWRYREADTPITMTRNRAGVRARAAGVDALIMVDSDMGPDYLLGLDGLARPFFKTAFDFFVEHYDRGPCVLCAPYCGPPAHPVQGGMEIPYMFRWTTPGNSFQQKQAASLTIMSREEAANLTGIIDIAAGPTGLCLIDVRAFGDPIPDAGSPEHQEWLRKADERGWHPVPPPWFDYEYADRPYNGQKETTEDVFFTRNCNLAGIAVKGLFDCWCLHHKPEAVGKPELIDNDYVIEQYQKAILGGYRGKRRLTDLKPEQSADEMFAKLQERFDRSEAESPQGRAVQDGPPGIEAPVASAVEISPEKIVLETTKGQEILATLQRDFGSLETFWEEYARHSEMAEKHPLRWTDGEGVEHIGNVTDKRDLEALQALVASLRKRFPDWIAAFQLCEVGSWVGESTRALCQAAEEHLAGLYYLHCVDTWEGSPGDSTSEWAKQAGKDSLFETFLRNVKPYEGNIGVVERRSPEAAGLFEDESLHLCFIDADHDYEAVKADILAWAPKVKARGILCGHDYGVHFLPGVKRAVDELFAGDPGLRVEGCIWWYVMAQKDDLRGNPPANHDREAVPVPGAQDA